MTNGIQYIPQKRRDPSWDEEKYRASMHALARRKKARKKAMTVLGSVIYEKLFGVPAVVAPVKRTAPRPQISEAVRDLL